MLIVDQRVDCPLFNGSFIPRCIGLPSVMLSVIFGGSSRRSLSPLCAVDV